MLPSQSFLFSPGRFSAPLCRPGSNDNEPSTGGGGGLGLPRYATLCARYLISYNGFVQQCFTVLHLATLGRLKAEDERCIHGSSLCQAFNFNLLPHFSVFFFVTEKQAGIITQVSRKIRKRKDGQDFLFS